MFLNGDNENSHSMVVVIMRTLTLWWCIQGDWGEWNMYLAWIIINCNVTLWNIIFR